jgi:hypothetical protein
MWRAAQSGWRVFVPVTVGEAALQALLILGDPTPTFGWGFAAAAVGSFAAIVVAVWLTACAASAAVEGAPRAALARAWRAAGALGWIAGSGLVGAAVAVAELPLAPVALLVALFGLPAVARGDSPIAGYRCVARAPWRYLAAVALAVLAVLLSWIVAFALGLFLTGTAAAALTWLWFGIASTVLLCLWCSLYRRCRAELTSRLSPP